MLLDVKEQKAIYSLHAKKNKKKKKQTLIDSTIFKR